MAYRAGKEQAARAWLLMGLLLSNIATPPLPPLPTPLVLAQAISAPENIQAECASFWT